MSAEWTSGWNQFEVIGSEADEDQMIKSWLCSDTVPEKTEFTHEEIKTYLAELAIGGHNFSL